MSRLGKKPIELPEGVEVTFNNSIATVKGPKGTLEQQISSDISLQIDNDKKLLTVEAKQESRQTKANHGLYRALLNNMVIGVNKGYEKGLILEGVGYRVAAQKNKLVFTLGFCHSIEYIVPPNVTATIDGNTKIKLESHDKQLIGQIASEIRALRKPEPYKGKGIRYSDEVIRKKVGKAASK